MIGRGGQRGSVLLAVLVLLMVLGTMMMAMSLTVQTQYHLARATKQRQQAILSMEHVADASMAYLLPQVKFDGTWASNDLPHAGIQPYAITQNGQTYQAYLNNIDAGSITVTSPAPQCRSMRYTFSPDFTHIVDVQDTTANNTDPNKKPAVASVQLTTTPTTASKGRSTEPALKVHARITLSRFGGYLRVYADGPAADPRHKLIVANQYAFFNTAGFTFTDDFQGGGQHHLRILYSAQPFPTTDSTATTAGPQRVRWNCASGICGAAEEAHVTYNALDYSLVPPISPPCAPQHNGNGDSGRNTSPSFGDLNPNNPFGWFHNLFNGLF